MYLVINCFQLVLKRTNSIKTMYYVDIYDYGTYTSDTYTFFNG